MNRETIGCVLNEETTPAIEFKIKGEDKLGFVEAEGILQDGGSRPNRNRRIYPVEELRRAIYAPRIRELVETGNMFGEAGHPISQELSRQSKVDPRYIQVWYKKLWMDDNLVKGVFTGTSNDLGRAFNDDLRRGQRPSFSLRAIGQLVREDGAAKVTNLSVVCYDRVVFPSHAKAYTEKILTTESANMGDVSALSKLAGEHNVSISPKQLQTLTEAGNCLDGSPIVIPLTQAEVANYLIHESENIQTAISTFDVLYESIQLNPSLNTVTMKTRMGDTFHICLEEAVKREVLDGISKFF